MQEPKNQMIREILRLAIMLLTGLAFFACGEAPAGKGEVLYIDSRDHGTPEARFPLYSIFLPEGWVAERSAGSVADTKLPLVELHYQKGHETIRMTIHNFPYWSAVQRIPPQAQIARWKQQFDSVGTTAVKPQAYGGFVGFSLWCEGRLKEKEVVVYGWALQLGNEHERTLSHEQSQKYTQMRSDVTLKATGPVALMEEQQEAITLIARSFELINAIPAP